jgi:predicted O-methyltransferase YrrM
MNTRSAYVSGMRKARTVADRVGLLDRLSRSDTRRAQYLRSMFAIYDARDLTTLDIPWWSYPAIDRVEAFLAARGDRTRVLEFGAGASTAWLAKRCREVHSIEHDIEFADEIGPLLAGYDNLTLHKVPVSPAVDGAPAVRSKRRGHEDLDFSPYVAMVEEIGGTFDLIVVDGRARVASLAAAVPHLADDGIVVFDNANRAEYKSGIAGSGLHAEFLRGLAPSLPYPSTTALLTRKETVRP